MAEPLPRRPPLISRVRATANVLTFAAGALFFVLLVVGRGVVDPAWVGRVGLVGLIAFVVSVISITIENRTLDAGEGDDPGFGGGGTP